MKSLLEDGDIEPLVGRLRAIAAAHAAAHPHLAEEVLKEAEYFATNATRMRYPEFREKGLFVSSGVVEAGCKVRHRIASEEIRHVLDCPRHQRHQRPALLPHPWEVRELLGARSGGLISTLSTAWQDSTESDTG